MLSAIAPLVLADVYDLSFPHYLPTGCPKGCASWADAKSPAKNLSQPILDALWLKGKPPQDAAAFCAMPGASAGDHGAISPAAQRACACG